MLFGNRATFAIEAMVEPGLRPPEAVWGRICVWVQGQCIGDYDDPFCALYSSYHGFRKLAGALSGLWRPEFEGLSDSALWNMLDGALYGYHGDVELVDDLRSPDQLRQDSQKYGVFDFLTNWSESFDASGKCFIVRPAGGGLMRILQWAEAERSVTALVVSAGDVDVAIRQYLAWFEAQAARLGRPVSEAWAPFTPFTPFTRWSWRGVPRRRVSANAPGQARRCRSPARARLSDRPARGRCRRPGPSRGRRVRR